MERKTDYIILQRRRQIPTLKVKKVTFVMVKDVKQYRKRKKTTSYIYIYIPMSSQIYFSTTSCLLSEVLCISSVLSPFTKRRNEVGTSHFCIKKSITMTVKTKHKRT